VVNLVKYRCPTCGFIFSLNEFEERRAELNSIMIGRHIVFKRDDKIKTICPKRWNIEV
jgi:hypothetical protein